MTRIRNIFAELGLTPTSKAASGKYLRADTTIHKIRYWGTCKPSNDCFGIQVLTRTVDKDIYAALSGQFIDIGKFTKKISGDKTEFYKEHPCLPDGSPDKEGILKTFQGLQSTISSLGRTEQKSDSRPTMIGAGFFPAHSTIRELGGISVQSDGKMVEVTDVIGGKHVYYPTPDKWEAYWERAKTIGDWDEKLTSQFYVLDGPNHYFELQHDDFAISYFDALGNAQLSQRDGWFPYYAHISALENLVGVDFHNTNFGIPSSKSKDPQGDVVINPKDNSSIIFDCFTPVFQYQVIDGIIVNKEILNDEIWNAEKVVYARTSEREVAYVGKTDGKLKSRMNSHMRLFKDYTKQRDLDYKNWAEGKTITIYAYKPECVDCLGLSVPIHTGLEHTLIKTIAPAFVCRA